uniref:glutathione transferase n=1 Tax=Oryza punctata TaxID=4537 RepID=A0A0E0JMQ6_ORYPU
MRTSVAARGSILLGMTKEAHYHTMQDRESAMTGGGEGGELRLLGTWSSPWVIRVRVALGMKGLSYEYSEEDLSRKSELLLSSNPVHKKVPILIHGGRPVCESLVVLEYVDEIWGATGPTLLPADPYDRATARLWANYVNDTFFPPWKALFRSTTAEQRAEAFKNVVPHVETLERAFGECSKGKGFFGGDAAGLVDVAFGSHLVWIKVVDEVAGTTLIDEAKFPSLAAWAERFLAVDAVRQVMPDAGDILNQYKGQHITLTQFAAMAGKGGELQLLGTWYSPYAIRAKIALELKGLSYEYIEQDLFGKSELLLKSNPVHKKVPVLIHGGRPVCESRVVLEYVDEAWPGAAPPLLPADTHDRATARFWATYFDSTFFPPWRALMRATTGEQRAEAFGNAVPQVEVLERAFGECSKGKAFFGGDAVGLVDVVVGSFVVWFKVVDEVAGTSLLDAAKFPGLAAWAERFLAVDAVREAMPDAGKLLEHYKGFLAKLASPAGST